MATQKLNTEALKSSYSVLSIESDLASGDSLKSELDRIVKESAGTISLASASLKQFDLNMSRRTSMVVLNLKMTAENCVAATQVLSQHKFRGPVVLPILNSGEWNYAKKLAESCLSTSQLLLVPCLRGDIAGLIRNTLHFNSCIARKFARIEINRPGVIKIASRDVDCTVRDISAGGACVALTGQETLKSGDLVSLSIELLESKLTAEIPFETFNIRAKVAWFNARKRTVGVEFLPK